MHALVWPPEHTADKQVKHNSFHTEEDNKGITLSSINSCPTCPYSRLLASSLTVNMKDMATFVLKSISLKGLSWLDDPQIAQLGHFQLFFTGYTALTTVYIAQIITVVVTLTCTNILTIELVVSGYPFRGITVIVYISRLDKTIIIKVTVSDLIKSD